MCIQYHLQNMLQGPLARAAHLSLARLVIGWFGCCLQPVAVARKRPLQPCADRLGARCQVGAQVPHAWEGKFPTTHKNVGGSLGPQLASRDAAGCRGLFDGLAIVPPDWQEKGRKTLAALENAVRACSG